MPNIHPGEVLEEEFLKPNEITRYRLAKDIGVPATRIAEICAGSRSITTDTALRLSAYFGVSPKFWLGLQEDFDLEEETSSKAKVFEAIHSWRKVSEG
ncbi:MAG: HigA family addiction module antidote protein [Deltaproteobacteria bacterium]|nr:HigA family addiction module antidote protein [Deltaproteobacteria bacterium]